MLNPYVVMSLVYASLAVLAALDSALTSFGLFPWFNGLRWLRVHLITLGVVTEVTFGLLPMLVAARSGVRKPRTRWGIWLALNAGLLTLLVGIPIVNPTLILTGGSLVFLATALLIGQVAGLRGRGDTPAPSRGAGRKFYIAGLGYFLLGITVGTGLWLGWGPILRIGVPIEVHIHANNWGFMSLMFAGLVVDVYPDVAGRPLAWPRSITPIFWMLTLGALGLVLGPWVQFELFSVPGILLYLAASIWLLLNLAKPLIGDRLLRTPGLWHVFTAQIWIVAPVLVAPFILLKVPGFPGAGIEQSAPQALIYGWVLHFGFAIVPYAFARAFLPNQPARLGGSWLALLAVHAGGVLLWASIFVTEHQPVLYGAAYALWTLSMLPIVAQLWRIARAGMAQLELNEALAQPPART